MRKRSLAATAAALAVAGAGLVTVSILVMWSGQPSGDSLESDVFGYYATNAARIRLGDVMWIAGLAALVAAAAISARRFATVPRRVFVGGLAFCAALLSTSAAIAWFLAGDAAAGTVDSSFERWALETHLFEAGAFLMFVPLFGAAAGIDRERRFGNAMTAAGIVAGCSVVAPIAPWNFLAAIAWIVGAVVFTVAPDLTRSGVRTAPAPHPVPAT